MNVTYFLLFKTIYLHFTDWYRAEKNIAYINVLIILKTIDIEINNNNYIDFDKTRSKKSFTIVSEFFYCVILIEQFSFLFIKK